MVNKSNILPDKLLSNDYYYNRLSMQLRSDDNIKKQVDTYVGIINNISDVLESIINYFDIFNEKYFEINNILKSGTSNFLLDDIGKFFGINRIMNVEYVDSEGIFGEKNETHLETITLTNIEMLTLIQVAISRNNFYGTAEELLNLYNNDSSLIGKLNIIYAWGNNDTGISDPLVCQVYFRNYLNIINTLGFSDNIIKLFYAGLLTIESLGITYLKALQLQTFYAKFDDESIDPTHMYFDPDFTNSNTIYAIFE